MKDSAGIRKDLIKAGKDMAAAGLAITSGGNISTRDNSAIYIKKRKAELGKSTTRDYVRVDLASNKASGGQPSSEVYMHLACYNERRDVRAVLHLHPVFSTAVANSRIKLGHISYELCASLGSSLIRARYKPSGSKALAQEIRRLIKSHNGILMPNHGIIVVGESLKSACKRALACERACQVLIFSRLLESSRFLPKREARRIISIYKK